MLRDAILKMDLSLNFLFYLVIVTEKPQIVEQVDLQQIEISAVIRNKYNTKHGTIKNQ